MTPVGADNALPSAHLIRSAVLAGSVLDGGGVPRSTARQSYVKLPTGGIYHSEDLARGERLLVRCGLVKERDDILYPSDQLRCLCRLPAAEAALFVLALAVEKAPPLWLASAVRNDALWPEFISDDDSVVLTDILPDPAQREAFLLSLGNRFDADAAKEKGALGEEAVAKHARTELETAGRNDLAGRVQRVSLLSDQLGYDVVAPTISGPMRRMEVKTCGGSQTRFEVFLTRNEVSVGLRDSCWTLVICRNPQDGNPVILGWCRAEVFRDLLPRDIDSRASWATVKLTVCADMLRPGLPSYE
jgi:hypothetical protein